MSIVEGAEIAIEGRHPSWLACWQTDSSDEAREDMLGMARVICQSNWTIAAGSVTLHVCPGWLIRTD